MCCACDVHVFCMYFAWVIGASTHSHCPFSGHTICKVLLSKSLEKSEDDRVRVSGFLHSLMDEGVFTLSDYKEVGCLVTVQCCQLDVDNHMTIM